jgi:hypothetical protein
MGTSQNNDGPGKGLPFVPSWTPPLPSVPSPSLPPEQDDWLPDQDNVVPEDGADAVDNLKPVPFIPPRLAPPGRFGGARRSLSDYTNSGSRSSLRKSLREYVRHGYGGAKTTTARFGGTVAVANLLGNMLEATAESRGHADSGVLDTALWQGRSASEVMDALVEAVRPVDGTQDAEAERASIRSSLSDVLVRYPDADLLNLSVEQRTFAIERFTAMDVFHRYELDLGKTIQEKAKSAQIAVRRLKEIKDYIKESVSASFRKIAALGKRLTTGQISQVVMEALQNTFEVFEGYVE